MKKNVLFVILTILISGFGCTKVQGDKDSEKKIVNVWLIGDSTMSDYRGHAKDESYDNPMAGWGQMFQPYLSGENLIAVKDFLHADSVVVNNRAIGGRTTRSYFEEGRWQRVYNSIQPGDFVIIQFGHNDASIPLHPLLAKRGYPKFVDLGYKEYLRLFVGQTREKGATPILLTPVARNHGWENDTLKNIHGDFPKSVKIVVDEMSVPFIDLNELSMESFTEKGKDYVTNHYFMNIPAGKFNSLPDGLTDNTHFQYEGADEVARLVYEGIKELAVTSTNNQ